MTTTNTKHSNESPVPPGLTTEAWAAIRAYVDERVGQAAEEVGSALATSSASVLSAVYQAEMRRNEASIATTVATKFETLTPQFLAGLKAIVEKQTAKMIDDLKKMTREGDEWKTGGTGEDDPEQQ